MKVLPADVYDTMELIAEECGGIGADRTCVFDNDKFWDEKEASKGNGPRKPMCLIGFCEYAVNSPQWLPEYEEFARNFSLLGITYRENNKAIYNRLGLRHHAYETYLLEYEQDPRRISWQDWCEELGVVRGE